MPLWLSPDVDEKLEAAGGLSFQLIEPFTTEFKAMRHELNAAVKYIDQVNQQNAVMVEEP
jgi:hypothetical protein